MIRKTLNTTLLIQREACVSIFISFREIKFKKNKHNCVENFRQRQANAFGTAVERTWKERVKVG